MYVQYVEVVFQNVFHDHIEFFLHKIQQDIYMLHVYEFHKLLMNDVHLHYNHFLVNDDEQHVRFISRN